MTPTSTLLLSFTWITSGPCSNHACSIRGHSKSFSGLSRGCRTALHWRVPCGVPVDRSSKTRGSISHEHPLTIYGVEAFYGRCNPFQNRRQHSGWSSSRKHYSWIAHEVWYGNINEFNLEGGLSPPTSFSPSATDARQCSLSHFPTLRSAADVLV